jgi:hypothetical protein
MYPSEMQNSRRRFLATGAGAVVLALSGVHGSQDAFANPAVGRPKTLAASGLPGTAAATDPTDLVVDYLKQWRFDIYNPSHTLLSKNSFDNPGRNYNLWNRRTRDFLRWEHQDWGINLGWTDDATRKTAGKVSRWFLRRPGTNSSPLRYGEKLALGYGRDPSFIRYSHRTVGINLKWDYSPSYEWRLLGGTRNRPVLSGKPVAIYNDKAGQSGFLVYFDRTAGGDIGWPDSQTWLDQLPGILAKAFKEHYKEAAALLLA